MVAIEVNNVWKKYKQYYDKSNTLKEKILFRNRNRYEERWILQDINLKLQKGEAVGLIGENGSGKSTLLKLLSKIIYPNQGEITVNGKVSSMLELGAGFHPDMTGRENIYMNASIFGLTREKIDQRIKDIIAFSEIEDYIDNPVRTYSSGMYMRLAFSVAINVEADILLVDEILAVGDLNFQKKCFHKMQKLKKEGVTIVLVSHDLGSVEKLCDKAVWINEGRVEAKGEVLTVCKQYLQYMLSKDEKAMQDNTVSQNQEDMQQEQSLPQQEDIQQSTPAEEQEDKSDKKNRWGNGSASITDVELLDKDGGLRRHFKTEESMTVRMKYKINKELDSIGFGIAIHRADGVYCFGTNTFIDKIEVDCKDIPKEGQVEFHMERLGLIEGNYTIDLAMHDKDGLAFDYRTNLVEFSVISEIKDEGLYRPVHTWKIF
jgi:ABC-type polysaccharide/polyol phosphate transport system ATPase subunit